MHIHFVQGGGPLNHWAPPASPPHMGLILGFVLSMSPHFMRCAAFTDRLSLAAIHTYIHPSIHTYIHDNSIHTYIHTWRFASAWAWSSKTLNFYGGRPSPCTPPHERTKHVPKRSPGVRFHEGFGRASFWGFRGPSLHPSIHPCIRSIFTVVFENTRFCMYVKPYFIDIYRRFWNIHGKSEGQKVVTWPCMYVCLGRKAR